MSLVGHVETLLKRGQTGLHKYSFELSRRFENTLYHQYGRTNPTHRISTDYDDFIADAQLQVACQGRTDHRLVVAIQVCAVNDFRG